MKEKHASRSDTDERRATNSKRTERPTSESSQPNQRSAARRDVVDAGEMHAGLRVPNALPANYVRKKPATNHASAAAIESTKQEEPKAAADGVENHAGTIVELRLEDIVVDPHYQGRAATSKTTVRRYAESMKNGAKFPPVVVFLFAGKYVLADGFHRVAAAKQLGRETIAAEVRSGTKEDALTYAVTANSNHGRPLTNADKRHNAILLIEKHPDWSDRLIAEMVTMSPTTVGTLRSQMSNLDTSAGRKGKDGKVRRSNKLGEEGEQKPFNAKTEKARLQRVLEKEMALWPEEYRIEWGDIVCDFARHHCPEKITR